MTTTTTRPATSPTAKAINQMIKRHPEYTQREIALGAGFKSRSANVILSHIKAGRSKIPLKHIKPLCEFLGENPKQLMAIAISEYAADALAFAESAGLDVTDFKDTNSKQPNK